MTYRGEADQASARHLKRLKAAPIGPRTMPHTFKDPVLRTHFAKTPMPPASFDLIDLPKGTYLDTEEEINVIAASLWIMSVLYDRLEVGQRPKTREELRKVSVGSSFDNRILRENESRER